MRVLGTDLLVGGIANADTLAAAICQELEVEKAHVYQAHLFEWEQSPSQQGTCGAYFSALGNRNTVLIRDLAAQGDIRFIVEIEFLTPVPLASLQTLCDEHGLTLGLSRDTAYPDETGTIAAQGYVLFRPGLAPTPCIVLENQHDAQVLTWGILDQPLPRLPLSLSPR